MQKSRRPLYYLLAFLIPLITLSVAFMQLGLAPFGSHNLLISDMGTQYIAFFTELRRHLLTHQFSFYSFSLSLGDSAFPLFAYYLISPFNLILLLFKASEVPVAINFIILLKIATIGLSMAYYLQRVYRKVSLTTLLFSTAYSLCGFVAMYFYDIMWLDALIYLPLITLSIGHLYNTKKTGLYFFTLALTIITNYYLGYMTCLYALCYFGYLLANDKPIDVSWSHYLKKKSRSIIQFSLTSLYSGLATAVILLPALLGMLKTSKERLSLTSFLPYPQFGLEIFTQFGIGGSNYAGRLHHPPSLFVGSLMFLLLIMFFLSPQIKQHQKNTAGVFLGLIGLSLWLLPINTIWHMFQQPNGFPFRNVYMFSFITISLAYQVWLTKPWRTPRLVWRSGTIAAILLSIGYLSANLIQFFVRHYFNVRYPFFVSNRYLLWSLMFILFSTCLLTFRQHHLPMVILALLCLSELVLNFTTALTTAPLGSQPIYAKNYETEARWIKKSRVSTFYRLNSQNSLISRAFREPYNNYNDAALFGFRGISMYSSTLNNQTRTMLLRLGLFSKNDRRISNEGTTAFTNMLLAEQKELSMTTNSYKLANHPESLGLGFAVNKDLRHVRLIKGDPLLNQNRSLQSMLGNQVNYFQTLTVVQRKTSQSKYWHHYDLQMKVPTNGPLYAYFPNIPVDHVSLHVNGRKKRTRIKITTHANLALGTFKKGQIIHVQLKTPKKLGRITNRFAQLDQSKFQTAATTLRANTLQLQSGWRNHNLKGQIQVPANRTSLFLSIPYDQGWRVRVDHRPVKTYRVMGNLTGISLKPGQHHVHLTYHVPGLRRGLLISFLSLIMYGITALLFHQHRKK
ncbi:YfhO family protein [Loigolactobacillus iwatensis]|uniref:YfhO family protein n=1 Tax=Loigolactobacillus iwatensis TaxID=1267156 RepID=UPI000F7F6469|nr:YfhO family protein [Loigolactobacillus iwatensis]